jgi:Replicase family/Primase C terminal 1 (PriCT-1)
VESTSTDTLNSRAAQSRFQQSQPMRPYCSDDPRHFGVKVRPRSQALGFAYVQPNSPWCTRYLPFDVDREGAAFEAEDAGLPPPTFTVINPRSTHAHVLYELERPIFPGYSGKADSYLSAVRGGISTMLRADPGYRGLLVQNPASSRWHLLANDCRYSLSEIAESIPAKLLRPRTSRVEHPLDVASRNCHLFERVRWRAYGDVQQCGSAGQLYEEVLNLCHELNSYSPPLAYTELRAIARSITKWTWRNRERLAGRRHRGILNLTVGLELHHRQRLGAEYTHSIRTTNTRTAIEAAKASIILSGGHPTGVAIADACGINRKTVSRHLRGERARGAIS